MTDVRPPRTQRHLQALSAGSASADVCDYDGTGGSRTATCSKAKENAESSLRSGRNRLQLFGSCECSEARHSDERLNSWRYNAGPTTQSTTVAARRGAGGSPRAPMPSHPPLLPSGARTSLDVLCEPRPVSSSLVGIPDLRQSIMLACFET